MADIRAVDYPLVDEALDEDSILIFGESDTYRITVGSFKVPLLALVAQAETAADEAELSAGQAQQSATTAQQKAEEASQSESECKASQQNCETLEQSAQQASASAQQSKTAAENAKSAAQASESNAKESEAKAQASQEAAEAAKNSMVFVTFDVDENGHVIVNRSELLCSTNFALKDNGHMEVSI